jgi:hypothetical protein
MFGKLKEALGVSLTSIENGPALLTNSKLDLGDM